MTDDTNSQIPRVLEENACRGYPFFAVQDFHSSSSSLAAHLLRVDYGVVTGANQRGELVASIVGVHAYRRNASFARAASGPTLAVSVAGIWVGDALLSCGRSTYGPGDGRCAW